MYLIKLLINDKNIYLIWTFFKFILRYNFYNDKLNKYIKYEL